jgi:HEAT repeat protein
VIPGNIIYHFKFLKPTLILKLQSKEIFLPFEWSFDAKTKIAWQSISSHPKDSYAQHLCLAAKELRDERLTEPLENMLNHERHFIRWAAAQALGKIGREQGINALAYLSEDKHPHVANAASNALRQVLTR